MLPGQLNSVCRSYGLADYWLNGKKVENPSVVDGWICLESKGQATVQVTDKYE